MPDNITLFNLFNFMPLNDEEKELFHFDEKYIYEFKKDLEKDMFYLGGQLKMKPNDIINLDSIQRVREIDRMREIEYGGPCNGFEAASILRHRMKLSIVENMIIKYNKIMELRENEKLKLQTITSLKQITLIMPMTSLTPITPPSSPTVTPPITPPPTIEN